MFHFIDSNFYFSFCENHILSNFQSVLTECWKCPTKEHHIRTDNRKRDYDNNSNSYEILHCTNSPNMLIQEKKHPIFGRDVL